MTPRHLANDQAANTRNVDIGAVVMMMVMVIIAIVTVVMMMMMMIIGVVTVVMVMMMMVILGELDALGGLGLKLGVVGDERLGSVWNRRQQVGV